MEKVKIQELIISHRNVFFTGIKDLIKRDIQEIIEKYYETPEIILITGVRRSGKSSLLKLISNDLLTKYKVPEKNILYINFDDERFINFSVNDFQILYEIYLELFSPEGKKFIFVDEIQNIKNWERWANRFYAQKDIKLFITGSNAKLIGSEASTYLTGRNRQIINWPFSFKEYIELNKNKLQLNSTLTIEEKIKMKNYLKKYLKEGGFPEIIKNYDENLLQQYFKDIIYRDIISRYSIRNSKSIKELCIYLSTNIGCISSYDKLKRMLYVKSVNTIKNYIEYLEEVFLFFKVYLFDFSIKRQIFNPGKYYSIDTGMATATGFRFSENKGHIMENAVFLNLKRKNYDIYYWKSKNSKEDKEVDFLIRDGTKIKELIQVCYDFSDKITQQREIAALLKAKKELNAKELTVITFDEEKELKIEGNFIKVIPLWKWLLNK